MIGEQTLAFLRTQPLLASYLNLSTEDAGGPYAGRHGDYGPAGFRAVRELELASADALAAVQGEGLDEIAGLSLEIVEVIHRYYSGSTAADYGYIDWYFGQVPFIVNQLGGPVIDIPNTMTAQQRLSSSADAEDYIARLAAFGSMLDQVTEKFVFDLGLGVALPPAILEGALSFLDGFTEPAPADHILVTHLVAKLAEMEGVGDDQRESLAAQALEQVESVVYPGYRALAATLRDRATEAPEGDGIWAQPNGEALYSDLVRFMGDTDLTPAAIHDIGLREVVRISDEMDQLLVREGYAEGTVGARMNALGGEARFLYPDTDAGRSELLASLNRQIAEVDSLLPQYFATIPTQGVEVRRIPVNTEEGAPGGYYTSPSLDGTRPGMYWINLRDMAAVAKLGLPTLTYHEALPGHHFQVALNLAQDDLPLLRRNAPFNAYIEGWALYAERLAWEMGMYADDPFGDLGRLQGELFRAARLVVDTGLHDQRWTREQAITFLAETTGSPLGDVTAEIERYMAWPGQALGYKLGMLKIQELRSFAEEELGERFDLRDFHDVVLLEGAMPLAILERRVREWVASAR